MPTPRRYRDAAAKQRAYRERRRLATIAPLAATPSLGRLKSLRRAAEAALSVLLSEMETYHDQRSEAWQDDERGQAFQEELDEVQEAIQKIQDAF